MLAFLVCMFYLSRLASRIFRNDNSASSTAYTWFAALWFVQFAILAVNLFDFTLPIAGKTYLFIMAGHLAFLAGNISVMMAWRPDFSIRPGKDEVQQWHGGYFSVYAPVAVMATMLSLYIFLSGSNVSLLDRLAFGDALHKARDEVFSVNSKLSEFGLVGSLASLLSPFTFVVIGAYGFFRGARVTAVVDSTWCKIWGPLAIFLIALAGPIVYGGRIYVIFSLFLYFASYYIGKESVRSTDRKPVESRRRAVRFITVTLLVLGGTMAATLFQITRDVKGGSPEYLASIVHHAQFSPAVLGLFGTSNFSKFYLLLVGYASSSSNILNYYFVVSEKIPGPFYGAYNFPLVSAILAKGLGLQAPLKFWDIRTILFAPLEEYGYLGNTWATILRDLAVDFGTAGAIGFLFLFGAFAQYVNDRVRLYPDSTVVCLLAIIRLICVWSPYHSLLFVGGFDIVIVALSTKLILFPRLGQTALKPTPLTTHRANNALPRF